MLPTIQQIRQAAFDRWVRRGRPLGSDREDWLAAEAELTFLLNYQTIADYPLDAPGALILHDRRPYCCRFCERTAPTVDFTPSRPLLAGGRSPSLCTAAVCNECQSSFRSAQARTLEQFRIALEADSVRDGHHGPAAPECYTLEVFKSLVACALSIMPESELGYFVDALEWVSNPDSNADGPLFDAGAACRLYKAPFLAQRSWTSIARRIDPAAPLPYMIYFLAVGGVLFQVPLPLCLRDQDLDGRAVSVPGRSFAAGEGESFEQARVLELQVHRVGVC